MYVQKNMYICGVQQMSVVNTGTHEYIDFDHVDDFFESLNVCSVEGAVTFTSVC